MAFLKSFDGWKNYTRGATKKGRKNRRPTLIAHFTDASGHQRKYGLKNLERLSQNPPKKKFDSVRDRKILDMAFAAHPSY